MPIGSPEVRVKLQYTTSTGTVHQFGSADNFMNILRPQNPPFAEKILMFEDVRFTAAWMPSFAGTIQDPVGHVVLGSNPVYPIASADTKPGVDDKLLALAACLKLLGGSISFTPNELFEASKSIVKLDKTPTDALILELQ